MQVFGWNKSDVEGKNISMLMPPPYSQMHNGILRAYNETGTSNIMNRTRELQGLHMDRYSFPIKLAVTKVAQTGTLFSAWLLAAPTNSHMHFHASSSLQNVYAMLQSCGTLKPCCKLIVEVLTDNVASVCQAGAYQYPMGQPEKQFEACCFCSITLAAGH